MWTCCADDECDLVSLCANHATVHRDWGHTLTPLHSDSAPPPAAVFGVSHCPKPEHAGNEGRISHYCRGCKQLTCIHCGHDDHVAVGHSIMPVAAAGAEAATALAAALPELQRGIAHHRAVRDQALTEQEAVTANRAAAVAAVRQRTAALAAQLQAVEAAVLAEVHAAADNKLRQATAKMASARSTVATLTTLVSCAETALAPGAPPAVVMHVLRSVGARLGVARDASVPAVDTTLELCLDDRVPVFPVGAVVTMGVDTNRSDVSVSTSGSSDSGDAAAVSPGGEVLAAVTLVRYDGSPADVAVETLCVTAVVAPRFVEPEGHAGGDSGGAGAGAGAVGSSAAGAGLPVTLTKQGPGVFAAALTCPAWSGALAAAGARLVVEARVRGVNLRGSPAMLWVRAPIAIAFDPAAGAGRDLCADRSKLRTTGRTAELFRGRTHVLRIGSGVSLDISLEVTTGPTAGDCSIALGAPASIVDNTFDYSSNTGHAFFLHAFCGEVNVPYTTGGGRYPALRAPNSRSVLMFHVRGTTLTFSMGANGAAVTPQPGPVTGEPHWTLPSEFHLLVACSCSGYSFKVSAVSAA